jgi:predicted  nucleic acid-binding Zn-ribbon protein
MEEQGWEKMVADMKKLHLEMGDRIKMQADLLEKAACHRRNEFDGLERELDCAKTDRNFLHNELYRMQEKYAALRNFLPNATEAADYLEQIRRAIGSPFSDERLVKAVKELAAVAQRPKIEAA